LLRYIEKAVFYKRENTEKSRVIPSVIHSILILDEPRKTSLKNPKKDFRGGEK